MQNFTFKCFHIDRLDQSQSSYEARPAASMYMPLIWTMDGLLSMAGGSDEGVTVVAKICLFSGSHITQWQQQPPTKR